MRRTPRKPKLVPDENVIEAVSLAFPDLRVKNQFSKGEIYCGPSILQVIYEAGSRQLNRTKYTFHDDSSSTISSRKPSVHGRNYKLTKNDEEVEKDIFTQRSKSHHKRGHDNDRAKDMNYIGHELSESKSRSRKRKRKQKREGGEFDFINEETAQNIAKDGRVIESESFIQEKSEEPVETTLQKMKRKLFEEFDESELSSTEIEFFEKKGSDSEILNEDEIKFLGVPEEGVFANDIDSDEQLESFSRLFNAFDLDPSKYKVISTVRHSRFNSPFLNGNSSSKEPLENSLNSSFVTWNNRDDDEDEPSINFYKKREVKKHIPKFLRDDFEIDEERQKKRKEHHVTFTLQNNKDPKTLILPTPPAAEEEDVENNKEEKPKEQEKKQNEEEKDKNKPKPVKKLKLCNKFFDDDEGDVQSKPIKKTSFGNKVKDRKKSRFLDDE